MPAGFEGYSVGYTEAIGVKNPAFIQRPNGFSGYSAGISSATAGGTIIEIAIGFKGYSVEQIIVPKVTFTSSF